MSFFADRLFDALARTVEEKPAQLHRLMGREPVTKETLRIESFDQLCSQSVLYPFLGHLHLSNLLPHLPLCPKETVQYLLYWIPEPLSGELAKIREKKPLQMPKNPFVRREIVKSWSFFLEATGTCSQLFSPEGDLEEILYLREEELEKRLLAIALVSFEPSLKTYIERTMREKIKSALHSLTHLPAFDFIRYLQKKNRLVASPKAWGLSLERWDGTALSFEKLCKNFGLSSLSQLLSQESAHFKNELKLHLSHTFWEEIQTREELPSAQTLEQLKNSFVLSTQYFRSQSSS